MSSGRRDDGGAWGPVGAPFHRRTPAVGVFDAPAAQFPAIPATVPGGRQGLPAGAPAAETDAGSPVVAHRDTLGGFVRDCEAKARKHACIGVVACVAGGVAVAAPVLLAGTAGWVHFMLALPFLMPGSYYMWVARQHQDNARHFFRLLGAVEAAGAVLQTTGGRSDAVVNNAINQVLQQTSFHARRATELQKQVRMAVLNDFLGA